MTRDSADHSQEGSKASPLTSSQTEVDSTGEETTNAPLSSEPESPIMMAVLPFGTSTTGTTDRRTLHGNPGTGAAVASDCATHDSTNSSRRPLTSTAPTRSQDHLNPNHHVGKNIESKLTLVDTLDTTHHKKTSREQKTDEGGPEVKVSGEKPTPDSKCDHASTSTSDRMCRSEPTSSAAETMQVESPMGVASAPIKDDTVCRTEAVAPSAPEAASASLNEEESSSENKTVRGTRRKRTLPLKPGQSQGRWTHEEHQAFLEGLKVYGREWKKVAERIPTRTSAQIRSHAQKYFAKIAREESLVMQEQAHTLYESIPRESSALPPASSFPPSVQRNVERILANPTSVEREVEDTLRALRERYRQLQIQLQERNRNRNAVVDGSRRSHIVQDEEAPEHRMHRQELRRQSEIARRKRAFEDLTTPTGQRNLPQHRDDGSSVSSPSLTSFSPSRELGLQEMTAVLVLGGSLQRSASKQNLQSQQQQEEHSSTDSSTGTNNDEKTLDDDSTTESKRQRTQDEGHKSDTDDSAPPSDGMVL